MTHFLFEDLKVYQKSLEFIDLIHPLTKRFPQLELYSLASQFRRAANSVALNIAEGSRGTKKGIYTIFANLIQVFKRMRSLH